MTETHSPDDPDWYVGRDGETSGPFTRAEIDHRLQSGDVEDDDLFWCQGWPEWRKRADAFPQTPPPVPSPALASQALIFPKSEPLSFDFGKPKLPPPSRAALAARQRRLGVAACLVLVTAAVAMAYWTWSPARPGTEPDVTAATPLAVSPAVTPPPAEPAPQSPPSPGPMPKPDPVSTESANATAAPSPTGTRATVCTIDGTDVHLGNPAAPPDGVAPLGLETECTMIRMAFNRLPPAMRTLEARRDLFPDVGGQASASRLRDGLQSARPMVELAGEAARCGLDTESKALAKKIVEQVQARKTTEDQPAWTAAERALIAHILEFQIAARSGHLRLAPESGTAPTPAPPVQPCDAAHIDDLKAALARTPTAPSTTP